MTSERPVTLSNGTAGIVRAIVPSDKAALVAALEELAPDSRERRFFFNKSKLSESELDRLSSPDGIDHIAYGLAVMQEGAMTPISVARCFRDREDPGVAEIAMVTSDPWQGLGAGEELMRSLCAAALEVGIRRWFVSMFSDNVAMEHLLDRFGTKCEERMLGGGVVEAVYEIVEPPGGFFGGEGRTTQ